MLYYLGVERRERESGGLEIGRRKRDQTDLIGPILRSSKAEANFFQGEGWGRTSKW